MFDLRADGCADEASWLEVLSPELHTTMPITPYRSFNPADVVNNRRVLLGVDGEQEESPHIFKRIINEVVWTGTGDGKKVAPNTPPPPPPCVWHKLSQV